MEKKPTISIVLPVRNEAGLIVDCLAKLTALGAEEIIVVDGGSTDGTLEVGKQAYPRVKWVKAGRANRAAQMNEGASHARGDVLLFLHADIKMPPDAVTLVRDCVSQGFRSGGFKKRYTESSFLLAAYELLLNEVYLVLGKNLVGTNAIFVSNVTFKTIGGFPEVDFLEDVIFSRTLKQLGGIKIIPRAVEVSARRYLARGVLRQIMRNGRILFRHFYLKENPKVLREQYESDHNKIEAAPLLCEVSGARKS